MWTEDHVNRCAAGLAQRLSIESIPLRDWDSLVEPACRGALDGDVVSSLASFLTALGGMAEAAWWCRRWLRHVTGSYARRTRGSKAVRGLEGTLQRADVELQRCTRVWREAGAQTATAQQLLAEWWCGRQRQWPWREICEAIQPATEQCDRRDGVSGFLRGLEVLGWSRAPYQVVVGEIDAAMSWWLSQQVIWVVERWPEAELLPLIDFPITINPEVKDLVAIRGASRLPPVAWWWHVPAFCAEMPGMY